MDKLLFQYKPSFPPFVFYIIWILPILCIPAGFVIYFTEGKDIVQLLSVSGGVGVIGPLLLYGLLKFTIKVITKKSILTINEKGDLQIKVAGKEDTIPLSGLTDIGLSGMAGMTNVQMKKKNGETLNFTLPGNMDKKQEAEFKETIAKFNLK